MQNPSVLSSSLRTKCFKLQNTVDNKLYLYMVILRFINKQIYLYVLTYFALYLAYRYYNNRF